MAVRAAAAAAALLCAALTMCASSAHAAPAPTVDFSGGSVLGLACRSQPSTTNLSVPANSSVTFVNRLGRDATLLAGGTSTSVRSNEQVSARFSAGPVTVSMTFPCTLGGTFQPMTVTVTDAPARPSPAASPTAPAGGGTGGGGGPTGGGPTGGGPSTSASSGSDPRPGAGVAAQPSTGGGSGSGKTASGRPSASASGAASNGRGSGTTTGTGDNGKGRVGRGNTGGGGSTGTEQIDPGAASADSALAGPTGAAGFEPVRVEPAVPAGGTAQEGPTGLLALVAAVCAIGVASAAIRAMLPHRPGRFGLA